MPLTPATMEAERFGETHAPERDMPVARGFVVARSGCRPLVMLQLCLAWQRASG